MAQTYTRQSSLADGDTITAALFNNEYNQLVNAFAYSSSSASSTGHRHDGTAGQGGNIHTIGDLDFLNKIVVDSTNNRWGVFVEVSSAAVEQIRIQDGAIVPVTDSDIDLGTTGVRFKDAYIDSVTTTGNVAVGGNLTVTGTTTFNGGTITMGDAATDNVVFGADVDSNIIPDDDNTYDLGSSSQEWKDLYVDGIAYLDGINFNGTAITSTAAELNILDGVTSTAAELNLLDGVTATTAELNILDGVTSTAAELNILDGVTSTAAELNILDGVTSTAAELNILDGVTSTAAELNLLDGVTATTAELNYVDVATAGTVEASKAIVVDSNKDFTGARNITLTGELDAATLDISGDADIDGTLEADAITIGGVTLAETISDTVGAMVSSNTETNITVTYEDSDNTLDFVIGTLNQDTTGNAATATALETARTIHGVSFDGTANIDLSEVIQDTVGAMVSSNTETNITVTYEDSDGTLDFAFSGSADTTGNAATATALETARTIHGVSFDGTANIDLSEVVQDTVGAMFSSNTESGITVDYQDGDGTIDLTVGTLNQNTTGSAATLTTARTIGGVSFDGSANITPTTFTTATFSGDVNVDSGLLFADVSTNRIGINQASPDVTLDLGANTDAVHVPVGTTAQRPASPAAGYFRYNSTTGDFEGYTDAWGAIAGSGGTAPAVDTMTGDGSDTTLTLTSAPVNENATVVTLDGVVQHKSTYSVSGNTLTFSTAPPSGVAVECITWTNTAINAALLMQDADGDTQIQVEESSDEDKIRFDTGGTERVIIDSTGVGIGTSSPSNKFVVAEGTNQHGIELAPGTLSYIQAYDRATSDYGNLKIDAEYIAFGTNNGTERMRIDSSGNVGIGTTPAANVRLDIRSNAAATLGDFRNASATGFGLYVAAGDTSSQYAFRAADYQNNALFSVMGDGKVGIGIASPETLVHIKAADTVTGVLKIEGGKDTVTSVGEINAQLDFGSNDASVNNTGNVAGRIASVTSEDNGSSVDMTFSTFLQSDSPPLSEKMRITDNGKVGIGLTNPNDYYSFATDLVIGGSSNRGMTLVSDTTSQGSIYWADGTSGDSQYRGYLIYDHSLDAMRLGTAGTERVRIFANGNIGYGVTSVSSVLTGKTIQVGYGQISSDHVAYNYNTNFTNNAYQSGNDATFSAITSRASGVIKLLENNFIFMNASSGTAGQAVSMTERMRVNGDGEVLIGTTSNPQDASLCVHGAVEGGFAEVLQKTSTTATTSQLFLGFMINNGATGSGQINANGTGQAAFGTFSDSRLKENITDLPSQLDKINSMRPVEFDYIESRGGGHQEGFIAQEVEEIYSDMVGEDDNGFKTLTALGKWEARLVKAIQEQQEQIEQLKTEIQTLKGE